MNCRILFDQALLKSRELLLPTLFPNSYPKDRILIQNYVAVIILLHSITLHIPFKRVGSPLLILCSGSMTITNLKEIIRTKFLLSNQPFIITTDEICNLFGKFSSDGVDNDEVFMTAMLCIFASLLLGYDVILRGESDHTCNLIDKIQQIKTLYPNLRTVLIQANKPGLLNRSFLQVVLLVYSLLLAIAMITGIYRILIDEGTISWYNGHRGDRGLRREQHAPSTRDDMVSRRLL